MYFQISSTCTGGKVDTPPPKKKTHVTTYQSTLWHSPLCIQDKLNTAFSMLHFPVGYYICNVSVTVFFLY